MSKTGLLVFLFFLGSLGALAGTIHAATRPTHAPRRLAAPEDPAEANAGDDDADELESIASERIISLLRYGKRHTVRVDAATGNLGQHGTGFVVRRFGAIAIVATNAHVITHEGGAFATFKVRGATSMRYPGYPLRWSQTDHDDDFALLAVRDEGALGDAVRLGRPRPGAFVACVGHPLGEEFLASKGHALKLAPRSFVHDCVTEKGSSGGPVFDSAGTVVGITTYGASDGTGTALRVDRLIDMKLEHAVVRADAGWQDTGVSAGQGAVILATGSWRYSGWYGEAHAAGRNDPDLAGWSYDPKHPHAALICRVGSSGATFGVRGRWPGTGVGPTGVQAIGGGRGPLWCRINDTDLSNNGDALDVFVQRW